MTTLQLADILEKCGLIPSAPHTFNIEQIGRIGEAAAMINAEQAERDKLDFLPSEQSKFPKGQP